ncbi:MAG: hypothetical protein OXU31_10160 [Gammaproteobacteria bacterium]|nr:hypothetical protein [Gammaproteobacteria bacterium]MDD9816312.1 hypothetical protein [Gammaproteobacteria bacterium]MDD9850440.1 hypothetical protein [Gammaproteobacteria bacterium]MDD9871790.1 hypothetical protein [Gammaproteobacteria bacterium]
MKTPTIIFALVVTVLAGCTAKVQEAEVVPLTTHSPTVMLLLASYSGALQGALDEQEAELAAWETEQRQLLAVRGAGLIRKLHLAAQVRKEQERIQADREQARAWTGGTEVLTAVFNHPDFNCGALEDERAKAAGALAFYELDGNPQHALTNMRRVASDAVTFQNIGGKTAAQVQERFIGYADAVLESACKGASK